MDWTFLKLQLFEKWFRLLLRVKRLKWDISCLGHRARASVKPWVICIRLYPSRGATELDALILRCHLMKGTELAPKALWFQRKWGNGLCPRCNHEECSGLRPIRNRVTVIYACFVLLDPTPFCLLVKVKYGGSTSLRNVGRLPPEWTASFLRRQYP